MEEDFNERGRRGTTEGKKEKGDFKPVDKDADKANRDCCDWQ